LLIEITIASPDIPILKNAASITRAGLGAGTSSTVKAKLPVQAWVMRVPASCGNRSVM
jgi:hypothetical protein